MRQLNQQKLALNNLKKGWYAIKQKNQSTRINLNLVCPIQVCRRWGFNVIFCANLIIEEIWTSSYAAYTSLILKVPKSKYILTLFCISQSCQSMAFLLRFFMTKISWVVDLFPIWICRRQRPSTYNGDPLAVRSLMSFFCSSSLGCNFLKTLLLMADTSAPISTQALYVLSWSRRNLECPYYQLCALVHSCSICWACY